MTEESPTLAARSVDVVGPIVDTEVLGMVDFREAMADTIPATEGTVPLKQESKLLAESIEEDGSSVKEPISSIETNSQIEEQMVITSVDTSLPAEETVRPSAETSPPAAETIPLTVAMNSAAEEITPSLEDPSSPSEKKAALSSAQTNSPGEETVPIAAQTSSLEEQIIPSANGPNLPAETVSAATEADLPVEGNITATKEIEQPGEEGVPSPGATILTAKGTSSPTEIVRSENAEGELTTTHAEKEELEGKKTGPDNKALERSTGEENDKAGKPSEKDVQLTEEDCKVNGDGNVAENQEVDDDMEVADEDVYSEEFQHNNGSPESASLSPTLSCQQESPDTSDCAGERSQAGRKPDITKHNYSRYNTVSYRKIKKGNTKQRIDEFESMLHIN